MDLFEYQARDLFAEHGVPVLDGLVADTPEAARAAAERIGGSSGSSTNSRKQPNSRAWCAVPPGPPFSM